ncbi:MAG: BrnT family toxin [Gammaproteobacteria bacterium]
MCRQSLIIRCRPGPLHRRERFAIFGRTLKDRYLVVAFTDRGGRLRIISAREMTRRERQAYEQWR